MVVWRHGQTAWNAGGRFQGQLDSPLTDLGRRQAAGAAAVLARLRPAAVVASDLDRAAATADVLGRLVGVPVPRDPRLREVHLGAWQGLSHAEVAERFGEEYAAWQRGDDVRRGGGETMAEVAARGAAAVAAALAAVEDGSAAGPLVVVTHGFTARVTVGALLGLPAATWPALGPLDNCSWSLLADSPRGWRLLEHNAGTLPAPEDQRGGDDR